MFLGPPLGIKFVLESDIFPHIQFCLTSASNVKIWDFKIEDKIISEEPKVIFSPVKNVKGQRINAARLEPLSKK